MGVDYEVAIPILKEGIQKLRIAPTPQAKKELLYSIVLYVALVNEARISEALDGVKNWLDTGKRTQEKIITRKRADEEERTVIIPPFITGDPSVFDAESDWQNIVQFYEQLEIRTSRVIRKPKRDRRTGEYYLDKETLKPKIFITEYTFPKILISIEVYAKRAYGINTHSLRYSGITSRLKKGENPLIVGKITKHKNMNQLLTYAQQVEADKAHRKQIEESEAIN